MKKATKTKGLVIGVALGAVFLGVWALARRAKAAPSSPPFVFTDVSPEVTVAYDYERAGYWGIALFKVTISNPNAVSATHTLQVMVNAFDRYYNVYQWQNYPIGPPWSLTLAPGESYEFATDFWNLTRQAFDLLLPTDFTVDFWLEDELGNKSDMVSIST